MTNLTGRGPLGLKGEKPSKTATAAERAHLAAVKGLPCVICGSPPPSDAHHVFCGRYGTRKASHFEVIPLCRPCHLTGPDAIHRGKESWVARNGPDTDYLPIVARMLGNSVD